MHSFLEKMNIQYFEEVLEYKAVLSVLFNSYAACLSYQEVESEVRIDFCISLLFYSGVVLESFLFFPPMKK